MADKKYLVFGGTVTSKNDRDKHYVTPREVIRLYRVDPAECHVIRDEYDLMGMDRSRYIELCPDPKGEYILPTLGTSEVIVPHPGYCCKNCGTEMVELAYKIMERLPDGTIINLPRLLICPKCDTKPVKENP